MPQAGGRQRRVGGDDGIDQRVHDRIAAQRAGLVVAHGVQAVAAFAPGHAQQAPVMHVVQQLCAGFAVATKPVGDAAVVKMGVHLSGAHSAAFAHKGQHLPGLLFAGIRPGGAGCARVHQVVQPAWHKAVVHKEIFFNGQLGVIGVKVPCTVAAHAVAQGQVLRSGRCAQGVGLHKAQTGQGFGQGGGRKQAARHGKAAQLIQCQYR